MMVLTNCPKCRVIRYWENPYIYANKCPICQTIWYSIKNRKSKDKQMIIPAKQTPYMHNKTLIGWY